MHGWWNRSGHQICQRLSTRRKDIEWIIWPTSLVHSFMFGHTKKKNIRKCILTDKLTMDWIIREGIYIVTICCCVHKHIHACKQTQKKKKTPKILVSVFLHFGLGWHLFLGCLDLCTKFDWSLLVVGLFKNALRLETGEKALINSCIL